MIVIKYVILLTFFSHNTNLKKFVRGHRGQIASMSSENMKLFKIDQNL